ncbi:hypothetical protein ACWEHA_06605 [Amycolatopsis nivea]
MAKFVVVTAVLVPLYTRGLVTPLAIATLLSGAPAAGMCGYLCWRFLRAQGALVR